MGNLEIFFCMLEWCADANSLRKGRAASIWGNRFGKYWKNWAVGCDLDCWEIDSNQANNLSLIQCIQREPLALTVCRCSARDINGLDTSCCRDRHQLHDRVAGYRRVRVCSSGESNNSHRRRVPSWSGSACRTRLLNVRRAFLIHRDCFYVVYFCRTRTGVNWASAHQSHFALGCAPTCFYLWYLPQFNKSVMTLLVSRCFSYKDWCICSGRNSFAINR